MVIGVRHFFGGRPAACLDRGHARAAFSRTRTSWATAWRQFLVCAVALAPVAPLAAAPSVHRRAPIALANAEDLVAPEHARWVLASVLASRDVRSALYAVERGSDRAVQLYPASIDPPRAPPRAGDVAPPCSVEPRAGEFAGHGLAYRARSRDAGTLYVVNHGRGETVEVFDLVGLSTSPRTPRVTWRACIVLPGGTIGNAVTVSPDGRIYATITPLERGLPRPGDVRYWTPDAGWQVLPNSTVNIPTGLASTPDGRRLYVSSFVDRRISEIGVDGVEPVRRDLEVPFGPDNLGWARDGALLVGGMEGSPVEIMRACESTGDPRCAFPGFVARLDTDAWQVRCIVQLGATTTTTAAQVGAQLWFGSSRSASIWRVDASLLERCPPVLDVRAGRSR